jgi:hypothetical protein
MIDWLAVALILNALAVTLLAICGFMLGSVLSRVGDALEALRPAPQVRSPGVQPVQPWPKPGPFADPRPAPPRPVAAAPSVSRWP